MVAPLEYRKGETVEAFFFFESPNDDVDEEGFLRPMVTEKDSTEAMDKKEKAKERRIRLEIMMRVDNVVMMGFLRWLL